MNKSPKQVKIDPRIEEALFCLAEAIEDGSISGIRSEVGAILYSFPTPPAPLLTKGKKKTK